MKLLQNIWAKLHAVGRRHGARRDIDEELRFHIDQQTAKNLAVACRPVNPMAACVANETK